MTQEDDIEAYLTTFERIAHACKWPKEQWVIRLAPYLTGQAQMAYSNMKIHESGQYDLVKEAILRRYNISEETYRQRFRQLKYSAADSPREVFTHLTDLYKKWMKPELKTHQQITETIVMEQFIKILPEDISSWVQKHRPNKAEKAISLAEDYLLAKKDAGRHTRRFQQSQVQKPLLDHKQKRKTMPENRILWGIFFLFMKILWCYPPQKNRLYQHSR
uniref:SCAN box domain-containing protein n=1 Tax=Xenopus tropicalis TaxID=8364 RepID=A0A803JW56_XENTR